MEIATLRSNKDTKMNELNGILLREKDYYEKVKLFEEACAENEILMKKYTKVKAAQAAPTHAAQAQKPQPA